MNPASMYFLTEEKAGSLAGISDSVGMDNIVSSFHKDLPDVSGKRLEKMLNRVPLIKSRSPFDRECGDEFSIYPDALGYTGKIIVPQEISEKDSPFGPLRKVRHPAFIYNHNTYSNDSLSGRKCTEKYLFLDLIDAGSDFKDYLFAANGRVFEVQSLESMLINDFINLAEGDEKTDYLMVQNGGLSVFDAHAINGTGIKLMINPAAYEIYDEDSGEKIRPYAVQATRTELLKKVNIKKFMKENSIHLISIEEKIPGHLINSSFELEFYARDRQGNRAFAFLQMNKNDRY